LSPDGGARSCAARPDREGRELFAQRLTVAGRADRFAVRARQVLELVTAGLTTVFEDWHDDSTLHVL
jgi:hypothetical protein